MTIKLSSVDINFIPSWGREKTFWKEVPVYLYTLLSAFKATNWLLKLVIPIQKPESNVVHWL